MKSSGWILISRKLQSHWLWPKIHMCASGRVPGLQWPDGGKACESTSAYVLAIDVRIACVSHMKIA